MHAKERLLCYRDNVFSILSTLLVFDAGANVVKLANDIALKDPQAEAFGQALQQNLHYLAGFAINFFVSTGGWLPNGSCLCPWPTL